MAPWPPTPVPQNQAGQGNGSALHITVHNFSAQLVSAGWGQSSQLQVGSEPSRREPKSQFCTVLLCCGTQQDRASRAAKQVRVGVLAVHSRWGKLLFFPKPHSLISVGVFTKCLPRKYKMLQSHCWVQPAEPSTGPKCSSVALPAVGVQTMNCPGWRRANRRALLWVEQSH